MIVKHTQLHTLLFDGSQEEIPGRTFDADGEVIAFDDFIDNNLEDLPEQAGNDSFNAIIRTGGFTSADGFPDLYKNNEGLMLYFTKRKNRIFVFAFGEFQPTRFKLYLEGIWELED